MYQKVRDARAELLFNKSNCFFAVLVAVAVAVIGEGSFSNDDGDGKEDVEKTIGLY